MNEPRLLTDDRERRELIAVCARAFWHDPLFDFLADDDLLTAHQMLPSVFRAAMRDFEVPTARRYAVDLAGRPRAFAGWLGPGSFPRPRVAEALRELRSAELLLKVHKRRAALRLLREVEQRHPHEPHWYLALLAADPTAQGRGFGSALLRPVLAECDEQGIPAYLETQKEANVAWYARAGFTSIDEVRLTGLPTIWRLWRDPQPSRP